MFAYFFFFFFFSSRRRHTRWPRDWSSDVCSSDLNSSIASRQRTRKRFAKPWIRLAAGEACWKSTQRKPLRDKNPACIGTACTRDGAPETLCRNRLPRALTTTQEARRMTMSLKLYVFPPSPRAFKVLLAAHQLGIDYELRLVDLTKGDQKAPSFLSLNPNARMPVLDDDGFILWESNAIVEYLASK